jgi:ribosome biogenesis GTPase / thiamine phosphate phosphatase
MLDHLGFDGRVEALFTDSFAAPGGRPGRVVRVERGHSRIATGHEDVLAPFTLPVTVGDWVVLDEHDVVVDVLPRHSMLTRVDPRSESRAVDTAQVLCANVDVAFVVEPLDRPVRATHADRVLALVWESGAVPVVVLTKADTHPDSSGAADALAEQLLGVDVLVTAAAAGDTRGIESVRDRLRPNRTGVVLGASGAGKSTLTNAIVGAEVAATGAVRDLDHRGRHTTTARELVAVPGGGVLIDTPGLRSLGLWDAAGGLAIGFADIEALALRCRFADCAHDREPGCAVREAIDAQELDADRLVRWRKLAREIARADGRQDRAGRAEERATQRAFSKMVRNDPNRYRKR